MEKISKQKNSVSRDSFQLSIMVKIMVKTQRNWTEMNEIETNKSGTVTHKRYTIFIDLKNDMHLKNDKGTSQELHS